MKLPRTTGTREAYTITTSRTRPHTLTHTPKTQMKRNKKKNGTSLSSVGCLVSWRHVSPRRTRTRSRKRQLRHDVERTGSFSHEPTTTTDEKTRPPTKDDQDDHHDKRRRRRSTRDSDNAAKAHKAPSAPSLRSSVSLFYIRGPSSSDRLAPPLVGVPFPSPPIGRAAPPPARLSDRLGTSHFSPKSRDYLCPQHTRQWEVFRRE